MHVGIAYPQWRGKRSRHFRRMRTRNFTYLARGPWLMLGGILPSITVWGVNEVEQGWGLLSQFSPFRYFPHFPSLSKQMLAIEFHVYIWQVTPVKYECDSGNLAGTFARSKIFLTKKIANGALATPTPGHRVHDYCRWFLSNVQYERYIVSLPGACNCLKPSVTDWINVTYRFKCYTIAACQ